MDFENYSEKQIHFLDSEIPTLLEKTFKDLKEISVIDLGCGEGQLLHSLIKHGLLKDAENVIGVDLSKTRCNRFKKNVKIADVICSDVCNVPQLKSKSFDFAICTQVIEHITEEELLLKEINRLLKNDGLLYISSVIKKWYGIYVYMNNGKIRLDPTHVKEYSSEDDFTNLLRKTGFQIIEIEITPVKYSLLDLLIRMFIRLSLISPDGSIANIYGMVPKRMRKFRNMISIPIIGYYIIEVLCKKQNAGGKVGFVVNEVSE